MGYPTKLLSSGEVIKVDLKPHWLYFLGPATTTILALILAIVVVTAWDVAWATWFTVIALILGALWLLGRFIRWQATYFVITNDKVIYRSGVFRRSGVQIPLERVNSVNFEQNLIERIVGAGDLVIESGGMGGPAKFTDVRHPDKVQIVIHDAIEENARGLNPYVSEMPGRAPAPGPSGPPLPPPVDVTSQLERLEGMLQRGTITKAEFEVQKAKLLGQ
jgi:membrane protein YdbS with pleckstrin-like domain